METLVGIWIPDNKISDLIPLSNLKHLRHLILSKNLIIKIGAIRIENNTCNTEMKNLKRISINDNLIDFKNVLEASKVIEVLKNNEIKVNFLPKLLYSIFSNE